MLPPMLKLDWSCRVCGREGRVFLCYDDTVLEMLRSIRNCHAVVSLGCHQEHREVPTTNLELEPRLPSLDIRLLAVVVKEPVKVDGDAKVVKP